MGLALIVVTIFLHFKQRLDSHLWISEEKTTTIVSIGILIIKFWSVLKIATTGFEVNCETSQMKCWQNSILLSALIHVHSVFQSFHLRAGNGMVALNLWRISYIPAESLKVCEAFSMSKFSAIPAITAFHTVTSLWGILSKIQLVCLSFTFHMRVNQAISNNDLTKMLLLSFFNEYL